VGRNIEAKQRLKASTVGNCGILEGDRIASLYNHRQMLEQMSCFPGILCDASDTPATLLCELDSHVIPRASHLNNEWVEDVGAGQPSVLICFGLSHLTSIRT